MTASGGVVSDYSDGGIIYRSHVFTSSGTFGVTDLGNLVSNGLCDYLVVAGGGSGAPQTSYFNLYSASGGGGAGGLRTSLPGIMPATSSQVPFSVSNYPIIIGAGGASPFAATGDGNPGSNTTLTYNGGTIVSNGLVVVPKLSSLDTLVDLAVVRVVTTTFKSNWWCCKS